MKKSSNVVRQAELIIKNYVNQINKCTNNNNKCIDYYKGYQPKNSNEHVMKDKDMNVFPITLIFLSFVCITLSAFCFLQCFL